MSGQDSFLTYEGAFVLYASLLYWTHELLPWCECANACSFEVTVAEVTVDFDYLFGIGRRVEGYEDQFSPAVELSISPLALIYHFFSFQ